MRFLDKSAWIEGMPGSSIGERLAHELLRVVYFAKGAR